MTYGLLGAGLVLVPLMIVLSVWLLGQAVHAWHVRQSEASRADAPGVDPIKAHYTSRELRAGETVELLDGLGTVTVPDGWAGDEQHTKSAREWEVVWNANPGVPRQMVSLHPVHDTFFRTSLAVMVGYPQDFWEQKLGGSFASTSMALFAPPVSLSGGRTVRGLVVTGRDMGDSAWMTTVNVFVPDVKARGIITLNVFHPTPEPTSDAVIEKGLSAVKLRPESILR